MIRIDYSIDLLSALKISTGIGTAALDNSVIKDSEGRVYIPGSSIKGKTRSLFYRFADALGYTLHDRGKDASGCYLYQDPCLVCRIFGSPHWEGQLYFGNALLSEDVQAFIQYINNINKDNNFSSSQTFGVQTRTNVAINRKFRVAQPDHLFSTECVDEALSFRGQISGEIRDRGDDLSGLALLLASIRQITHLGADRSRGLGRCQVTIEKVFLDDQVQDSNELIKKVAVREDC